jgi:hypothetical protein
MPKIISAELYRKSHERFFSLLKYGYSIDDVALADFTLIESTKESKNLEEENHTDEILDSDEEIRRWTEQAKITVGLTQQRAGTTNKEELHTLVENTSDLTKTIRKLTEINNELTTELRLQRKITSLERNQNDLNEARRQKVKEKDDIWVKFGVALGIAGIGAALCAAAFATVFATSIGLPVIAATMVGCIAGAAVCEFVFIRPIEKEIKEKEKEILNVVRELDQLNQKTQVEPQRQNEPKSAASPDAPSNKPLVAPTQESSAPLTPLLGEPDSTAAPREKTSDKNPIAECEVPVATEEAASKLSDIASNTAKAFAAAYSEQTKAAKTAADKPVEENQAADCMHLKPKDATSSNEAPPQP